VDAQAGLRLRAYLDARPPTPAEIARHAGCSRQWVWEMLAGRVEVTPQVIQACRDLGVPVAIVFGPDGELIDAPGTEGLVVA
jgi:transcriptional regulator with XRE-family HTH domain